MKLIEEVAWILGEPWTERHGDWTPLLSVPLSSWVSLDESHPFWALFPHLSSGSWA